MKVVHFFHRVRLSEGGTVRAALEMCRMTADLGHDVTLVTFDGADVPASWGD